jgi:hypothetical protein
MGVNLNPQAMQHGCLFHTLYLETERNRLHHLGGAPTSFLPREVFAGEDEGGGIMNLTYNADGFYFVRRYRCSCFAVKIFSPRALPAF